MKVDQQPLIDAQRNVDALIRRFNGLQRAATFALGAIGIGKAVVLADEYLTIENKLKAVTNSTEEFVSAQKGVEQIATQLMQPVADVADSFLRYQLATESLGRSQEEVLDFTKRVTQAMILSGATSQEAHRAAVQLAQGFGKNFKAAAQDLKSVKEQAPVLARIIEKAAGGLPGTLLVMAKEGKITSKLVFDAVRAEGEKLDADFAKRQKTFGNIFDLLGNKWLDLIKKLRPAVTWIIAQLEKVVDWVGKWIEDGSAINDVIAALVVIVGSLAYAFSGLFASMMPVIGAFLAIEDFVGFIRGDQSLLEEWLDKLVGKEKTEQIRKRIQELVAAVGEFFKVLAGDGDDKWANDMAATFKVKMIAAWREITNAAILMLREALGEKTSNFLGIRKAGQMEYEDAMAQREGASAAERNAYAHRSGRVELKPYNDPTRLDPLWDGFVPTPTVPQLEPEPWAPMSGSTYQATNPYRNQNMTPVEITNNITVQGNADAPVAREIGTQAGRGVAEILGRDRSAVGAGFGVAP